MPSIPVSDGLDVTGNIELAPWSSLVKYAQDLPRLVASRADLSRWQVLTLSDPAVHSLDAGLSIERPIDLGGASALTLGADASIHFEVITGEMFSPDFYGDNIAIADGESAVRLGLSANGTPGASLTSGPATFGLDASIGIAFDTYRLFSSGPDAPTVFDAVKQSVSELVIPLKTDDLGAMPAGIVVTLGGQGSLKFSGTANLLTVANPLASVALPAPLPGLAVSQGASVEVGGSWEIASEYQVRVQKMDAGRVRLGWYRKHSSEFTVTASAGANISAGALTGELFPRLIGAISPAAAAGEDELKRAGLSDARIASIEGVLKSAVSRRLEVAIAAEFGSLHRNEAAFLYEIDLAAMDDAARDAVGQALHGNLSGLTKPPKGVTEVRSVLTRARTSRFTLKINLLGIFNFTSVAKLALKGTVTWTPSTGEVVIVDEATASRIQTGSLNLGANEEKLRHVMAESFLITAAYRGSQTAIAPPQFKSTHAYFRLENSTSPGDLRRFAMALAAIHLPPPPAPQGVANFGRTTLNAEAAYDEAASLALFLDDDGRPRGVEEYESAGRRAIQLLVPSDGDDAFRLRPVADDAVWAQMKDLGPANFRQIFPAAQVGVIAADYLAIRWWADSMHETAQLIARILRPGAADSAALRQDLAKHLRDVAARAHEQFGTPWGLVAMYLVSGGRAVASGSITGPRYVFAPLRPLAAAG